MIKDKVCLTQGAFPWFFEDGFSLTNKMWVELNIFVKICVIVFRLNQIVTYISVYFNYSQIQDLFLNS